jgi:hypothetical protein
LRRHLDVPIASADGERRITPETRVRVSELAAHEG